jgi:MarR family 2-MHQ and catechol resistance regulon transcriptional repressor
VARSLDAQTRAFQSVMVGLLKLYQFRDRNETVAYGLSVSQAYALRALAESGPLAMNVLAKELDLTVSSTTRVVDGIAARKLVKRSQSPVDRRIWHVALTARGQQLWRKLEGELLAIDAAVLSSLGSAERETLIRAMDTLARATRAWREEKSRQTPA